MDKSGKSDPFCTVCLNHLPDDRKSTNVVSKTLNPVWSNKIFSFPRPVGSAGSPIMATFKCWDKDMFDTELMGVVQLDVGGVPVGTMLDKWLPLEVEGHKVKLRYMAPGNTNFGSIHVFVSSGNTKTPSPDVFQTGGITVGSLGAAAPTEPSSFLSSMGLRTRRTSAESIQSDTTRGEILEFLYVKVIKGRNLAPMDQNGSSDPYAVVSVNNRNNTFKTRTMESTLNPQWNPEEFFTFPYGKDSRTITVNLFDDDSMSGDDPMGQVMIAMDIKAPGEVKYAWHDVQLPHEASSLSSAFSPAMSKLKKMHASRPTKLGQIYVCIGRGFMDQPPAEPEMMPSFRFPLGHINVEVLAVSHLSAVAGLAGSMANSIGMNTVSSFSPVNINPAAVDRPYVKLLHEGRTMKSRVGQIDSSQNVSFVDAGAHWEYDITEIKGNFADMRIQVWDKDTMTEDNVIGEVIIPTKALMPLRGQAWTTWMEMLPVLPSNNSHLLMLERPSKPVGSMQIRVQLTMDPMLQQKWWAMLPYLANSYMHKPLPPSKDGSLEALLVEVGRLVDVLLAPTTSALAVMVFMQTWENKTINVTLIALVGVTYLYFFDNVYWLWPFYFGLGLLFQGYVLGVIREQQPVFLWQDEKLKFTAKLQEMWAQNKSASAAYQSALDKQQLKLQQEMLAENGKEKKESRLSVAAKSVANTLSSTVTTVLSPSEMRNLVRQVPGLSIYYALMASVSVWTEQIHGIVSVFEKCGNLINFKDREMSMAAMPVWFLTWLAVGVLWAVLVGVYTVVSWVNPFGWTHLVLLLCLVPVLPVGSKTAEIVATIDGVLIGLPVPVTPIRHASINILTQRAIKQLDFQNSQAGRDLAELNAKKAIVAQEQAKEAAERDRKEFIEASSTKASLSTPQGVQALLMKRLRNPVPTLRNLFARIPSNRDFVHQCRTMRAVLARPHDGKWTRLPKVIDSRDPQAWNAFLRSMWSTNNASIAQHRADIAEREYSSLQTIGRRSY